MGFRYRNIDKLAYNHADSHPRGVGSVILSELRAVDDWKIVRERIGQLVPIAETRPLEGFDGYMRSEMRRCFSDAELAIDPRDYYDLFRPLQGTLKPYLDGRLSCMAVANEFIEDSLHCEWAYIVNLDNDQFEVWRGLQKEVPPQSNRYGAEANRMGYFPCALVREYALSGLPEEKQFCADLEMFR